MTTAASMIRAAADAGADAVKFQSFKAKDLLLPTSPHFATLRQSEMDEEQHWVLAGMARDCGIAFLSTPFGLWAIELLEKIGVPAYKVASMDCTNKYLLGYLAQTGKPIYLSTGMATLPEIAESLEFLEAKGSGPVTLLHCLSLYPASAEDLNLETIPFLRKMFEREIGYSDHYPGAKACLAAAMLGATIIETHFTLDSSQEGGDHSHSVEPAALKELVESIRLFSEMRGKTNSFWQRPDREFHKNYRRGVYAARDLNPGDRLTAADLLLCRPISELTPNDMDGLLGGTVREHIESYAPLAAKIVQQG